MLVVTRRAHTHTRVNAGAVEVDPPRVFQVFHVVTQVFQVLGDGL